MRRWPQCIAALQPSGYYPGRIHLQIQDEGNEGLQDRKRGWKVPDPQHNGEGTVPQLPQNVVQRAQGTAPPERQRRVRLQVRCQRTYRLPDVVTRVLIPTDQRSSARLQTIFDWRYLGMQVVA